MTQLPNLNTFELSIDIKETSAKVDRKIKEGIRDYLNDTWPKKLNTIKDVARKHIFNSILAQPEYQSITSGQLRTELGLVDGGYRLYFIIDEWLRKVEVNFSKFRIGGAGLTGGIKIYAIKSDYTDILSKSESIFTTEKGEDLPWLKWLLLDGGSVIIADYSVKFKQGTGRTGGGTMKQTGSWSVPSQFSGTLGDNFITRAIESIQDQLEKDVIDILDRN